MSQGSSELRDHGEELLNAWLGSCTRGKKISRNTIAIGIVILDHLRTDLTSSRSTVMSAGGEIKGSRGKPLSVTLEKYEVGRAYLKEVTTRQSHQDGQRLLQAFQNDAAFSQASAAERDAALQGLLQKLAATAKEWLNRPSLEMDVERRLAPSSWIQEILQKVKGRSNGIVEQHLVGAKLERRFASSGVAVPNHPAHAADVQTERRGDFELGGAVYHVTASPSEDVVRKCAVDVKVGKHPVLLIPRDRRAAAVAFAQLQNVEDQISIVAIEDFIAMNIIEMATAEESSFFQVLQQIVDSYNARLSEVETDHSLMIKVR